VRLREAKGELVMFTRMLLPLDGTLRAEDAIPLARRLASASGAQIYLLHVEQGAMTRDGETSDAAIKRRLEEIAKELRSAGIDAHAFALIGQTPRMIAATMAVHGIDLVVLAPELHAFFDRLRRPSVTADVLTRSSIPVLIAPAERDGARESFLVSDSHQIIVPLDGSAIAEQATPLALRLARQYQRSVLLVRVIAPIAAVMIKPGMHYSTDVVAAEEREAQRYLLEVTSRLRHGTQVPIESMVLRGVPATQLLGLMETKLGSVVVMSTHGRSGMARIMAGSVALEVARQAPIPLFIVPATHVAEFKSEFASLQLQHGAEFGAVKSLR
jgi:nucleotide-binding universal stress UspA family protein